MEHWNWQHEQVSTFYPFLNSGFLGEDKFICVRCFEIIGEYSAAICTRSGAFLEQVITTTTVRGFCFQVPRMEDGPMVYQLPTFEIPRWFDNLEMQEQIKLDFTILHSLPIVAPIYAQCFEQALGCWKIIWVLNSIVKAIFRSFFCQEQRKQA